MTLDQSKYSVEDHSNVRFNYAIAKTCDYGELENKTVEVSSDEAITLYTEEYIENYIERLGVQDLKMEIDCDPSVDNNVIEVGNTTSEGDTVIEEIPIWLPSSQQHTNMRLIE